MHTPHTHTPHTYTPHTYTHIHAYTPTHTPTPRHIYIYIYTFTHIFGNCKQLISLNLGRRLGMSGDMKEEIGKNR